MTTNYRICSRCVMDTTDPDIKFDESGVCSHYRRNEESVKERLFLGEAGQEKLNKLVDQINSKGRNKKYDCIIGVSGGVDSTYVASLVKKLGLRPLAVHLDNGWDSKLATSNIEKALKKLDVDLCRYVVDWEEFKDLQLSFLRASASDAEIPTDHAISALLYRTALKEGVQFIITGSNVSAEGVLPTKWAYGLRDWRHIRSAHKKFGKIRLEDFPPYSLLRLLYYVFVKRLKTIHILNYMKYVKKEAREIIEKELGWKYYGGKHYESICTPFLQAYILPKKFGIDKRRAHLSALICSVQ